MLLFQAQGVEFPICKVNLELGKIFKSIGVELGPSLALFETYSHFLEEIKVVIVKNTIKSLPNMFSFPTIDKKSFFKGVKNFVTTLLLLFLQLKVNVGETKLADLLGKLPKAMEGKDSTLYESHIQQLKERLGKEDRENRGEGGEEGSQRGGEEKELDRRVEVERKVLEATATFCYSGYVPKRSVVEKGAFTSTLAQGERDNYNRVKQYDTRLRKNLGHKAPFAIKEFGKKRIQVLKHMLGKKVLNIRKMNQERVKKYYHRYYWIWRNFHLQRWLRLSSWERVKDRCSLKQIYKAFQR